MSKTFIGGAVCREGGTDTVIIRQTWWRTFTIAFLWSVANQQQVLLGEI